MCNDNDANQIIFQKRREYLLNESIYHHLPYLFSIVFGGNSDFGTRSLDRYFLFAMRVRVRDVGFLASAIITLFTFRNGGEKAWFCGGCVRLYARLPLFRLEISAIGYARQEGMCTDIL